MERSRSVRSPVEKHGVTSSLGLLLVTRLGTSAHKSPNGQLLSLLLGEEALSGMSRSCGKLMF